MLVLLEHLVAIHVSPRSVVINLVYHVWYVYTY